MTLGVTVSIGGALAMAVVSTLGDFIWATWIPSHRPVYGLIHGTLLFLCIGLYLGALTNRQGIGAIVGAIIGGLAAASFYGMASSAGYSIMFVVWMAAWIALGLLNGCLKRRKIEIRAALARGALAAVGSGVAFYLISGIWFPFDPEGWDYLAHFTGWTLAYFFGFAALLVNKEIPQPG